MEELQKELSKIEIEELKHKPFDPSINQPDSEHIVLTCLEINKIPKATQTDLPIGSCLVRQDPPVPVDMKAYLKFAVSNEHFGSPNPLTDRQIGRLTARNARLPSEGSVLLCSKFRFKSGHLEILLKSTDNSKPYSTWITPHLHPSCCADVGLHLTQNKPIISGHPGKLAKALFLKGCHS